MRRTEKKIETEKEREREREKADKGRWVCFFFPLLVRREARPDEQPQIISWMNVWMPSG